MPAGVGSSSTAAGDPQCGHGVREADSGGDGGELDGALLDSAVAGVGGAVRDRDLRPGQRGEFGEQPRLVGLDGEHGECLRVLADPQIGLTHGPNAARSVVIG